MYKLVSVCLAFSLIVSAADVKAVKQINDIEVTNIELKVKQLTNRINELEKDE